MPTITNRTIRGTPERGTWEGKSDAAHAAEAEEIKKKKERIAKEIEAQGRGVTKAQREELDDLAKEEMDLEERKKRRAGGDSNLEISLSQVGRKIVKTAKTLLGSSAKE